MDVTCRNKKLSTDKNRIVKAVVFVACILLTVIYGILIFNACKQREQAWNRQAKAVFLEAVGNELKKLDKMEKYGFRTVTSLFQQKTLEADIPDSVVFALQDGTHVYHLPLHRRNNAYFKDGDKNVYLSLILEKYPFVRFIDNDRYDKENNISSVILASKEINNGYLCEADLYITNPEVIRKYQYVSNILGSYSLETDDWSFRIKDGYISEYQKGNTYCYNYYGISYWTKEDCQKLRSDWAEIYKDNKGVFWEEVPLILKKENYKVEIRQCNKQDIMEIDNYYELAQLDETYR